MTTILYPGFRADEPTPLGKEIVTAANAEVVRTACGVYSTTEVDNLLAGLEGLTADDIDTLAEINAVLTDADLASQSYVDAELADVIREEQRNAADGFAGLNEDGHLVGTIQHRTGTAAEIDAVVLADGEHAYVTDLRELRIGDGSTLGGELISAGIFAIGGEFVTVTSGTPLTLSIPCRPNSFYRVIVSFAAFGTANYTVLGDLSASWITSNNTSSIGTVTKNATTSPIHSVTNDNGMGGSVVLNDKVYTEGILKTLPGVTSANLVITSPSESAYLYPFMSIQRLNMEIL